MKILKIPSIPMSKIIRLIKIITLFKRKQQMQIQKDFSSNLLILSVNSIFLFKKKIICVICDFLDRDGYYMYRSKRIKLKEIVLPK